MESCLKILYVDDHAGIREGLGGLMESKHPQLMFKYAENKEECLAILRETSDVEVVILDLNLGGGTSGLSCIPDMRKIKADIKILVYTMYNDFLHVEEALKSDIQGFLSKNADFSEFEKAVLAVAEGNVYFNQVAQQVLSSMLCNKHESLHESEDYKTILLFQAYKSLTGKEQEVFNLLVQLKEVDEIAGLLGKSVKTVQNQKSMIYQKMDIRDRLDMLDKARILGILI